ncbi:MAG TPA: DUF4149 domain-containing protein [Azospirillum sp.]
MAVFAAALWWGSLSVTGFLAVPTLFASLPTPALAGSVAARLFSAQGWVAVACGVLLLFASRPEDGRSGMDWRGGAVLFVLAGLLLALLSEFAVAPRIMARGNLRLWHGLGAAMYVVQWLCAAAVLWKVTAPRQHD